MGGDFYMKFKRSLKSVLAAVLSAVLTLGAVGGLAPVKAWADDINLPAITLSPGQSTTIMVPADLILSLSGELFNRVRNSFCAASQEILLSVPFPGQRRIPLPLAARPRI